VLGYQLVLSVSEAKKVRKEFPARPNRRPSAAAISDDTHAGDLVAPNDYADAEQFDLC
jgi:hypothetical protein